jgi:SAM-dependent methyltransferase
MTAAVFDAVAETYDAEFTQTRLARLLRGRVWAVLPFTAGQHVLELGCGTGEDALWLAQRGVSVLATDTSSTMLAVAARKLDSHSAGPHDGRPSVGVASAATTFERQDANDLRVGGPFDGAFANFGVLNCVADLRQLAARLPLRRGARFVAVVMAPFCAWETAWYLLHGDVQRATRRWQPGATADIGGQRLPVWYPSPRTLAHAFAPRFVLRHTEGLGTLLPPSYLSHLLEPRPGCTRPAYQSRLLEAAARLDGRVPLGYLWADHYVAVLERQ